MENLILPSRASWFGEGLRWIGSLFVGAGNWFDRPTHAPAPLDLDSRPDVTPPEEAVLELRHRIQTGCEMFTRD
jgi:hypothetical protein